MKWKRWILCGFMIPQLVFAQNRYDVVIDEFMADPSPSVGMPAYEWIEVRNVSAVPINLQNWRIGDASSQSGPLPNYTLKPDSFLVICTASAVNALSVYGPTLSVTNFPSLDNDGDDILLKAANGRIIHSLSYNTKWYKNDIKKEGGWTLEMIDSQNPCTGIDNWAASSNPAGGTPGKKNSVDAIHADEEVPQLKRAYSSDNLTIMLVFNEPIDSTIGATATNYSMDGGFRIISAVTVAPFFNKVMLKLNGPMVAQKVYHVSATNIKDCKGNLIGSANEARVGVASDPAPGDWIINEILFNPKPGGEDFVEFFNNSTKIIDAARLYIANRQSDGTLSPFKPLSTVPYFIFPGDYMVETSDELSLMRQYLVKDPENILIINTPPTFPDDEGDVVALDYRGYVLDEVIYEDDWHFKLLTDVEGVSLERIDPAGPSQDPSNWHSAASTAGYGTPTYRNSQYQLPRPGDASLTISPKIFSPDNDGNDDVLMIEYRVTKPGYIANTAIYDVNGRLVRSLVRNKTMGIEGFWCWDGLDEKGMKLPVGIYVLFTEIFDLTGNRANFKNAVVLARKL